MLFLWSSVYEVRCIYGRMERYISARWAPAFQGSNIVFISSYTAYHPEAPIAMYAISKTALVALTKALAEELGPDGIRVNCAAPGTPLATLLVDSAVNLPLTPC